MFSKKVIKSIPQVPKGDVDDLKAIQTAIDFEGKGADFYARLRDEVTDPQGKGLFRPSFPHGTRAFQFPARYRGTAW